MITSHNIYHLRGHIVHHHATVFKRLLHINPSANVNNPPPTIWEIRTIIYYYHAMFSQRTALWWTTISCSYVQVRQMVANECILSQAFYFLSFILTSTTSSYTKEVTNPNGTGSYNYGYNFHLHSLQQPANGATSACIGNHELHSTPHSNHDNLHQLLLKAYMTQ